VPFELANAKKNQGAICCRHIFSGDRELTYISIDEDDYVIFSCGQEDHFSSEDWVTAGVWHFQNSPDISFVEVPVLNPGEEAIRKLGSKSWKVENPA